MKITSGVTLANLACTGDPDMCAKPGWMVNLVGDSDAGKSIFGRNLLAANFYLYGDKFRYYHDDIEKGVHWDNEKLFGKPFADNALEPAFEYPEKVTVEAWYGFFVAACEKAKQDKKPFLYVLDSWDSLNTKDDSEYLDAMAAGKDKGSYGTKKAKLASLISRNIVPMLEATGSVLLVISQTRDNINPMSFETKTRSGGWALKFFSSLEVWFARKGYLKLDSNTGAHGIQTNFKQKRSRLMGHPCTTTFPITFMYGIDDTQANIDYLVENKVIVKEGHSLVCDALGLKAATRRFAAEVEKVGKSKELAALVTTAWRNNEETLVERVLQGRPPRYGTI